MNADTHHPIRPARAALTLFLFAATVLPAAVATPAPAKPPPAVPSSECMDCHEAEFKARKKGQPKEWVGVRPEAFAKSAHGALNCVDCHNSLTETPHESKLPKVDCVRCHEPAVAQFQLSIHGAPRADGKPPAATCATCHGANTHELLPAKHIDSPVSKFNLLPTCATCHDDEKRAHELGLTKHDAVKHFRDSIHGQGLYKMGLNVAPSCNDCHGVHDIRALKDAAAHTSKANLSATCTTCHVGVEKTYLASVHGEVLAKQPDKAPVCTDCHTAHDIERPSSAHFKATSDQLCGKCHEGRLENYHETYHGKAIALNRAGNAPAVAACYDCHGHHDVFKSSDQRSRLHSANIVKTCGECHDGANAAFTQYQPHADPSDGKNYPLLHKVYLFMTTLLIGVFVFFTLHTGFWVGRMALNYSKDPAAFRAARAAAHHDPETYRRFNPFERFLHMLVVTSFMALVITGMPLKFYYAGWAKVLFNLLGGPESARILHHLAAIVTFGYFALHLGSLAIGFWKNRRAVNDPVTGRFSLRRVWSALFGPDSMSPSFQDFRDLWAHGKWFFGRGEKPQWDRWTYWERFDYLAVFWGVAMIGVSGLVLWFPVVFTKLLPGWLINIAFVIHSDEALLAAGFIFAFHFFNTHFRIDRFPMDTVIFSGHITKTEMLQERKKWYDRLVASGKLDQHRVLHSDWESRKPLFKALGFTFLFIGVCILALMVYALLSRLGH
ncbi:MAG: cytochrome b/b6 domain-containing protein [Opitutae bacterium]|nr:cytochrome b/b6 domain-containing protein [Opitutae bacterium]